ncbi:hypothetical protein GCM10009836_72320 [Pseudonocardia ailaonensis]|uniref:Glyceraldehyde 3-phosphate dehydrogenase catalytic domain-containing protein n=1 Tax=Pseudonocardia ailaonensis TaxID=367279 RepID=A0ABN2NRM3_9PSEU
MAASGLRIPVVDTALVEVTACLAAPVTAAMVGRVLRSAGDGPAKGLLTCTTEPTVSGDVLGLPEACRVDLARTRVSGELVTVLGWFDPESAHAHRVADVTGLVARLLPRG